MREVFGSRIREFRQRRGLLQRDLPGPLAGAGYRSSGGGPVSTQQISLLESGKGAVSFGAVFAFAEVLDVAPVALLLPSSEDETVILPSGEEIAADMLGAWFFGHSALPSKAFEEATWRRIGESVPTWAPWHRSMDEAASERRVLKQELAECYGELALERLRASGEHA